MLCSLVLGYEVVGSAAVADIRTGTVQSCLFSSSHGLVSRSRLGESS